MSILYTAPEVAPRGADLCLLLDADYLAYMVGGISQSKDRNWDIKGQERVCLDEEKDVWVWADPLPLIEWRVDNEIDKLKDRLQSDNIEVWLTPDEGNFRYEVAQTRAYKSGRTGIRPYHYQAVRDYLLSVHQAEVAVECEADDMVATRQMDHFKKLEKSVIVSNDKDLKGMFGRIYIPRTDELSWITWEEAALHFYGQMITGDSVDSIPGCKGRGPKFWDKIVSMYSHMSGEELVYNISEEVLLAYEDKGHDHNYFIEQGQLLHMRRDYHEMWHPDYDWEEGYNASLY